MNEDAAGPEFSATVADYAEWRAPRFGCDNPERLNNPLWEDLVRNRANAWSAAQFFNGPSAFDAGPGWCFDRFGQSETLLPDGRTVWVAGEHEDSYDPDFYIYNDVVVRHPDGALTIYGYPRMVFPPTDFHSATLVGDRLVIIGSLGYANERRPDVTPVFELDLRAFTVSARQTFGPAPGWLHRHRANLTGAGDAILIQGGKVQRKGEQSLVENIDDWRLNLADWRWERLTERRWARWEFRRRDGKASRLWEIGCGYFWRDTGGTHLEEAVQKFADRHGYEPDLDLFGQLYRPPVPHTALPEIEGEWGVVRIDVDGVTVRYVSDSSSLQMTIEGDLPADVAAALTTDLRRKLEGLERAPHDCITL